ncbi:phosphatase PAP2 family protein [Nocardia aurea]|uniref:phosphatase PAP2 family protein n=1 Tax=Nocardia aurea TaxID=2144174 RepID=UPI0033ACF554
MSVDRHDPNVVIDAEHPSEVAAAERFVARGGVALAGVAAIGIGFGALTALVKARWEPLLTADQAVTDTVVAMVARNTILREIASGVTDLGATATLILVLAVSTLWLLLRRQPRLAAYVVLTATGGLILNPVVKELVGRLRPVVETPVYRTDGWSFPSGHAMSSLVCYGIVLLVFAPALRTNTRRITVGFAVVIVTAVGLSRIALGVHYLTDVLAGWLLGTLWLVLATIAFHRWRGDSHIEGAGPLPGDVPPADRDDLRPVPDRHPPLAAHPWREVGELAVAWVMLVGALIGLGMLVRGPQGDTPALRWDHTVVATLAENRTPAFTSVLDVFGEIGNTTAIIVASLVVAVLAVAVLRSLRPVLFLGVALVGEITVFLTTTAIVDRSRPQVPHLNPDLPPTSSFPSGHVAASLTLYACTAALIWATTRRWPYRIVAVAVMMIPVLVAGQRLYAGAHYPTDIVGAVLLSSIWTAIAWWVIEPVVHSDRSSRAGTASPDSALSRPESPSVAETSPPAR